MKMTAGEFLDFVKDMFDSLDGTDGAFYFDVDKRIDDFFTDDLGELLPGVRSDEVIDTDKDHVKMVRTENRRKLRH